jgi:PAS domain S-box-containing protein
MNILLLEDSETDAEIVQRLLKKAVPDCHFRLAMNKKVFLEGLQEFNPDLILADNSLPQFNALEALEIVNKLDLNIPFILVTGAVSEEYAAEIIKQGADDYILKDRMSRLPKAIDDALKQRSLKTEKAEALRQLLESEENLKAIFDSASEAFVLTDIHGVVKDFNYRSKEMIFFVTGKEIRKDESIYDLLDDSRVEYFEMLFFEILKGESVYFDKLYDVQTDKACWINLSLSPVRKGNVITGVCITGRDITEKKFDEQRKEFDQNNLHALINNTNDPMWSVDRNFNLITSNQAFDELVILLSGSKPVPGTDILKDNLNIERIFQFKGCYERAFAGETFTEIEHSVIPFEIWSELSFYPIYEGEMVIGTACFSRNITARKKAEDEIRLINKRISSILNTLPANIALLDETGIIIDVNESWRRFADENGYAGESYGIGDNYLTTSRELKIGNDEDGEKVARGIGNILNRKIKEFVFEYACHAPGVERWFRLVATPLQEKEYGGAVVMHIDISEIRRLEKEKLNNITEQQKKITRAVLQGQEKERTRLGQELHDNISQLLAATKMKLGFCVRHYEKALPVIKECSEYVQEAMTEARNISHKMVLPRFEENGFRQSLELLIQKYQNAEKMIELETSRLQETMIPGEIKETLYRIVQEQLNNIEKHARASKIKIQVLTYPDRVDLLIRDNGIGFDMKMKRNGIGITNILNRAESYNGTAEIISDLGKGCSLLVAIPLHKEKVLMQVSS